MEIELSERQINEIAYKAAVIIVKKLREKNETPEMVSTKEAANILRITPKRMREIADNYPHVKTGDAKNSRLLFERKSLIR